MRLSASLAIFTLCLGLPAMTANAGLIVAYDIPQTGSGFTSLAPASTGADIVASNLSAVGAINPNTSGNHFYFNNWNSTFNLSKFYENTITVAPGKLLELDNMTYSVESTGSGGAFQVRSSLDGFTSIIDQFTINNADVLDRTTDFSTLSSIANSVTFRFYASAPTTGTSMGFANHLPGGAGGGLPDVGQNIRFNGTVSSAAVPEPSSLMMFASAGLLWFTRRKKNQRSRITKP